MRLSRPREFQGRLNVLVGLVMKHAAFELYRDITLRNPVDTGRSRANWNVAVGAPDTSVTPITVTSSGGARAPREFPVLPAINAAHDTIHITNNLPYIQALERGHSKQAPSGFVQLAVDRVVPRMQAVIATAVAELG